MTLSPTDTSTGTRPSPSSLNRPGPTAMTSPSWGFSLAVSGMTSPDAVVCSASTWLITMRSSSGLMETDTVHLCFPGCGYTFELAPCTAECQLLTLGPVWHSCNASARRPYGGGMERRELEALLS